MLGRKRIAPRPAETGGIQEPALARLDADVLKVVDARLGEATRRAGTWLACRLGCTECCIGPFPINQLDALRLRRGLQELADRDPGRAAAIRDRARVARARLTEEFPGDARTGALGGDQDAEDRYFEKHAGVPCPVLDPATGGCELYDHRPVSCRTYGPPVKFNSHDLPPCRLCFIGAPPAEIERCRVEPDPDHVEGLVLDRLRRSGGESAETIIAWAVAAAPTPSKR